MKLLVWVEADDAAKGLNAFNTLLAMATESAARGESLHTVVDGVRGVSARAEVTLGPPDPATAGR